MSFGQFILQAILWTLSSLFVLQQLVSMTRSRAPRRNRRLPAPSPLCERTGKFEVRMHDTVFAARQAE